MRKTLYATQIRKITGVSPTIFIPKVAPDTTREAQIEKNTQSALELIRAVKGAKAPNYIRKYTVSFEEVSREVENLLGSASKLRRPVNDNEPMDKLTAMERMLRHAMWSYLKDEGNSNCEEMEKWLVYTPTDQTRMATLRQESEKKAKYAVFRQNRDPEGPQVSMPSFDLPKEYNNFVDREYIVEKRQRYDTLKVNTTSRNDSVIEAELAQYIRPTQDKRLDHIVELLEKFKPILAREAIMQRLTVKHLEGQLGLWRYLDWNPEVRDRAEVEADHYSQQWWYTNEEKRLSNIRLRSKEELTEIVERAQNRKLAELTAKSGNVDVAGGDATAMAREKLLQEIIRLQSRQSRKDSDSDATGKDGEKASTVAAVEEIVVKVSEESVNEKGLLGLDFIGSGGMKA